jgi:protein SCO1
MSLFQRNLQTLLQTNMKVFLTIFITIFTISSTVFNVFASDFILKDLGQTPAFTGIDSNNEKFNSNNVLQNKIGIVNFFFTSCEGPCPSLMLSMKKILTKSQCSDVQFVSISVDTKNDSPDVLKKYQVSRGFDKSNWSFISMTNDDLIKLLNEGLKLGSGGEIVNHSTRIVVIDKESKIRALLPGMEHETVDKTLYSIQELCK